jgi:transaldolase
MEEKMTANPLLELHEYGVSVWYDNIQREMLQSGELQRLMKEGIRGMTSNPTIFKNAIVNGQEYQADIAALARQETPPIDIYESLAIADVGAAADVLRPLFDQSQGEDGYVSIEVSPFLAHETQATVEEARRLFATLQRPNIMIKVPATPAGLPAVRTLIGEGINVNVTLLFSVAVYRQVTAAYFDGLETYAATGGDLSQVASVASFFVSRVDTLTDKLLQAKIEASADEAQQAHLRDLQGKLAVANAKVVYQAFKEIFGTPRFQRLVDKGARVQRVLWASTSAKNPAYSDVMYVEELIGAPTVNTMPPATIEAFKDHGRLRNSLDQDVAQAEAVIAEIEAAGLSIKAITGQLLDEGVASFAQAFHRFLRCPGRLRHRQWHRSSLPAAKTGG